MKILFICPTREWLRIKSSNEKPKGTRFLRLPTLSAATIAALTPKEFEFKLIDEQVDFLNFDEPADLVAITCTTATANRAYQIARTYQQKKVPVVLGGIHPTLNAEESKQYGTVIVGSAESIWTTILKDFQRKELKKVYYSTYNNLKLIKPDRSIFKRKGYITINLVESSRGCIHSCNFCSTASAFNGEYITKDIGIVIDEIKSFDNKFVFFVDDNIIGNVAYAKKLFKELIPLKIKWISQTTYLFGLDGELLDLAKQSGCIGIFIGFDSISDRTLQKHNKTFGRIKLYRDAIKNIHKKGILIQGSFIFGSDLDEKNIFKDAFKFVQENKIDGIFFGIYTPLPQTPVFLKMSADKRIIDKNWDHYDYRHCVFKPKNMTGAELYEGIDNLISEYFRKDRIFLRLIKTFLVIIRRKSLLLFAGYYFAFLSRIKMLKRISDTD